MKRIVIVLILFILLNILINPAFARIEEPTLVGMVQQSDLIILAYIRDISPDEKYRAGDYPPRQIATAQVLEVWKGEPISEVKFHASPGIGCDHSDAVAGETVLLMLSKYGDSEIMRISGYGRGRWPIMNQDSCSYKTTQYKSHLHSVALANNNEICTLNVALTNTRDKDGALKIIYQQFQDFYAFKAEVMRLINTENRSED